jgi:hypothetical protein
MYQHIARACGGDEAVLWRDLAYLGYDSRLQLAGARSVVVSVHATVPVRSRKQPLH